MTKTSETSETTGGIRAFARHKGVSHSVVSKAITTGRLARSVSTVGGRTVIDFALADEEWDQNRTRVPMLRKLLTREEEDRRVMEGDVTDLEVPYDSIGVFWTGNSVVVGVLKPSGDRPDQDDSYVTCMSRDTAHLLAMRLLQMAKQGPTP